jgi:hypothetical protein
MTERVASWKFRREFWWMPWPRWEHRARCPFCGYWLLVKRGRALPDVPTAYGFAATHLREAHDIDGVMYGSHRGWGQP